MKVKTAGESHGEGIVAFITDVPAGLKVDFSFIEKRLKERRSCYGRSERMRIEEDRFKIISGIKGGYTIGSPIVFLIENREWERFKELFSPYPEDINESRKKKEEITVPRGGHADLCGWMKYGYSITLVRERASARETVARVVAGALAELLLRELSVKCLGYTKSIKDIKAKIPQELSEIEERISSSSLLCPDPEAEEQMKAVIDDAEREGESIGGIFEVVVEGLLPGIGSYMEWEKRLDARIAYSVMSIPAVKGVEIGEGFAFSSMYGSVAQDGIVYEDGFKRTSNKAGGIEGGLSNGERIIVRGAVKPPPTTKKYTPSIDVLTKKKAPPPSLRADVCVVPACAVIANAMIALEIADAVMEKFGRDTLKEIKERYEEYRRYIKEL